jgi:hypothetical protein
VAVVKLFIGLILLASPLVALEYWLLGALGGFRLTDKLSAKWKHILKIYGWLALLSGGAAAGVASMHGCSLGGLHAGPQLVDTSSTWRPLPQLFYIQPDAKSVEPSPAVPPVAENTETNWTGVTSSTSFVMSSPAVTTTSGSGTVWTMSSGSYVVEFSTDAQGNVVQTVTDAQGNVVASGMAMMGGSPIVNSRMAKMKSYPASERPSDCVASCLSHHRSWVTPVENSYCEKDTSNADGGFYGWVKQGSAWIPTAWPATEESDERAPNLIWLKPHEQVSLTEGIRSY